MPFAARQVQQLRALIDEIDGLARNESQFALRREAVSNWSVAEQLDHAVRVCSSILAGIHEPGETLPRRLNWIGRMVLATGYIPRGRGRSPKSMLPMPCSREELGTSVSEVRSLLARVASSQASESNDPIV
ncbi:MAG: hypothetical protein ABIP63_02750, partial [Thermoanaerobaculia bacterium]